MASLQRLSGLNWKNCFSAFRSFYSTHTQQNVKNIKTLLPVVLQSTNIQNHWIYQEKKQIESPGNKISSVIEIPRSIFWIPPMNDVTPKLEITEPLSESNKIEKQAAKLIVIRRHKMRKHKLRKLRKKMKFEWAKRRQRREMRKEKQFQSELLAQIKEAEKFSAVEFVAEKIRQATEVPIPKLWKGKRLPEFLIREKMGLLPK